MTTAEKTNKLVMTALMMCMIIVLTMFVKVPIPLTQGYVHLGDAMIFISVMLLGWKYGAAASAIGSAMADIFCGVAMWAPWTLVIKFIMALVMGKILEYGGTSISKIREIIAMALGGLFMTAGYFVAEGIMYGNWAVAALGIPWNVGQFAVGMVIAVALSVALCKTSAGRMFTYRLRRKASETEPSKAGMIGK